MTTSLEAQEKRNKAYRKTGRRWLAFGKVCTFFLGFLLFAGIAFGLFWYITNREAPKLREDEQSSKTSTNCKQGGYANMQEVIRCCTSEEAPKEETRIAPGAIQGTVERSFTPILFTTGKSIFTSLSFPFIAWGRNEQCLSFTAITDELLKGQCVAEEQQLGEGISNPINPNIKLMHLNSSCVSLNKIMHMFTSYPRMFAGNYTINSTGKYIVLKNGTSLDSISMEGRIEFAAAPFVNENTTKNGTAKVRLRRGITLTYNPLKKEQKVPIIEESKHHIQKRSIPDIQICRDQYFTSNGNWPFRLRNFACFITDYVIPMKEEIENISSSGVEANAKKIAENFDYIWTLRSQVGDLMGESRTYREDISRLKEDVKIITHNQTTVINHVNTINNTIVHVQNASSTKPSLDAGYFNRTVNGLNLAMTAMSNNFNTLRSQVMNYLSSSVQPPQTTPHNVQFPPTPQAQMMLNGSKIVGYFDESIGRYDFCTKIRKMEPECMPDRIAKWQDYIYASTSVATIFGILVSAVVGCIAIVRYFGELKRKEEVEKSRALHSSEKGFYSNSQIIDQILDSYHGQGQFRAVVPFKCVLSTKPRFFTENIARSKCLIAAVYKGTRLPILYEKDLGNLNMGNNQYDENTVERSSFVPIAMCDSEDSTEKMQNVFTYFAQLLDRPEFMGYPLSYIRAMRKCDVNTFLESSRIKVQSGTDRPNTELIESMSLESVFGMLCGMESIIRRIMGSSSPFDGFTFFGMDGITKPKVSTNIFNGGEFLGLVIISGPSVTNAIPSPGLVAKSPRLASSYFDFQMMSSVFGHPNGCSCKDICMKFDSVLFGLDVLIASCDNALWYQRFKVYLDALKSKYETKSDNDKESNKKLSHSEEVKRNYKMSAQSTTALTVFYTPRNSEFDDISTDDILKHQPLSRDYMLSPLGSTEEWNLIFAIPTFTDELLAGLIRSLTLSRFSSVQSIMIQVKAKRVKKHSNRILQRRKELEAEVTRKVSPQAPGKIDSPKTDAMYGYM